VSLDEKSETVKSLVFAKEKELALALMKVAELTSQLDQLRASSTGSGPSDKTARQPGVRPASTGSVQEHRHRVVVKPTIAPPPPPVAAAAILAPAGDKVNCTPEFTCMARPTTGQSHRSREGLLQNPLTFTLVCVLPKV